MGTVEVGEARLDEAIEAFGAGDAVLVRLEVAEGRSPSARDALSALNPVGATAREVARFEAGGIAAELGLETEPRVVLVEDAQWADESSLEELGRLLESSTGPRLVVIAHRPLRPEFAGPIRRLVAAAGRSGRVLEIAADGMPASLPDPPEQDRELAALVQVAGHPVAASVAARAIDRTEQEILDGGERLVGGGYLEESRAGYTLSHQWAGLDVGEARRASLSGRLARALEETGGDPAAIGRHYLEAGEAARGFPLLAAAAVDAETAHDEAGAFQLAGMALDALRAGGVDDHETAARLHLVCGRYQRAAGSAEAAARHLDHATRHLTGVERIDALGFAAAVADDRQRPQEAERLAAVAEWEAATQAESAKLGSLFTFRARELSRLGFPDEADAVLAKGLAILDESGSPEQRSRGRTNRAWILLDRGEARLAEAEFGRLRHEAAEAGPASLADKEAYWARALFAAGEPDKAREMAASAVRHGRQGRVEAPEFITRLAEAEGALLYGRPEEALEAADRALEVARRSLPAWQNVPTHYRAAALARLGRVEEAQAAASAALDMCPPGSDGWRWRTQTRALQIEVGDGAGGAAAQEAADLTDELLQGRFYAAAIGLMISRCQSGRDPELGREAAALAVQVGNPMLAAEAIHAAGLWSDSAAAPVIAGVHHLASSMPEDWAEQWSALPHVAAALSRPVPEIGDDTARLQATLDGALRRAGLAGVDVVLSPAQRRARGLVRRPPRRRPVLAIAAAALAVVGLAAGTTLVVSNLNEPVPTTQPVAAAAPVTTVAAALEDTLLPIPTDLREGFFHGSAPYRGGDSRTGVVEFSGVATPGGYYWRYPTADPVEASLAAHGRLVYVPSTDGNLYALDMTTGDNPWTLRGEGAFHASPGLGQAALGELGEPMMVAIGGDDRVVRLRDALRDVAPQLWKRSLADRITGTPVLANQMVLVPSTDGFVYALRVEDGEEVWRFPAETPVGPFSASLAMHDGIIYAGNEDGHLYLIDAATGSEVCSLDTRAAIVANPVIADGVVYAGTTGSVVWTLPAGACNGVPSFVVESPVEVPPAVIGDVMFIPSGQFLNMLPIDTARAAEVWEFPFTTGGTIRSAPVVAGDTVYVGSDDRKLYAVDIATGQERWSWVTGNWVRSSPVVLDGLVVVASGDGTVTAIGEKPTAAP